MGTGARGSECLGSPRVGSAGLFKPMRYLLGPRRVGGGSSLRAGVGATPDENFNRACRPGERGGGGRSAATPWRDVDAHHRDNSRRAANVLKGFGGRGKDRRRRAARGWIDLLHGADEPGFVEVAEALSKA